METTKKPHKGIATAELTPGAMMPPCRTEPTGMTLGPVAPAFIRRILFLPWLLCSVCAASAQEQLEGLFKAADEIGVAAVLPDQRTLRSRLVTMDLERMSRARAVAVEDRKAHRAVGSEADSRGPQRREAMLTLNLFDDTVVTGVVERAAPTFSGGYSVSGRLVDDSLGDMTLVVNGDRVLGTVRRAGRTFRIRPVGASVYEVREIEPEPLNCGMTDVRDIRLAGQPGSRADAPGHR